MAEPDATQVVAGSGKLYIAILGSTLPGLDAHGEYPVVWPAAWKPVGYTEDGIDMVYTPTVKPLHVDEETAPVSDVLTDEKFHIHAKLSEATLQNLNYAIAASAFVDDTALNQDINVKVGSKALVYYMVGVEGPAPGTNKARVVIMQKAIASSAVSLKMQRKDKVVIPIQFEARQITGQPLFQIHDFTALAS